MHIFGRGEQIPRTDVTGRFDVRTDVFLCKVCKMSHVYTSFSWRCEEKYPHYTYRHRYGENDNKIRRKDKKNQPVGQTDFVGGKKCSSRTRETLGLPSR